MSERRKPIISSTASLPQREHYAATHSTAADVRFLVDRVRALAERVEHANTQLRNALQLTVMHARRDVPLQGTHVPGGLGCEADGVVVRLADDGSGVLVTVGVTTVVLTVGEARQVAADLQLGANTVESQARASQLRDERCRKGGA